MLRLRFVGSYRALPAHCNAEVCAWMVAKIRNDLSVQCPDDYNKGIQDQSGWGTMSTLNLSKTERIDVRASTPVKQLLQEAARACHKNVSEFLLDAGVTAAAQTLADRRQFVLDDTQWQAFQEALDRPVQSKPRLKKLLREPGVLG